MRKIAFYALATVLLTECMAPMPATTSQAGNTQGTANQTQQTSTDTQNPLGDILGGLANAGAAQAEQSGLGGVLGNILASVTGSVTTTQANLIGSWTYTEPSVQFESDNLLTQAGGSAAAAKVENQLVSIYKMVGITPGKLTFNFAKDGTVTYTIGSRTNTGTYVFDAKNKIVGITTANGMNINAYVTVSGNLMSLCFDSSKVLSLFSAAGNLANGQSTLGNIGAIAQNFKGMKTGFKFKR